MKFFTSLIIIFTCGFHSLAFASTLEKISRVETKDIIQLYFSFDSTPEFTAQPNKKRIDLLFFKTKSSPGLSFFAPDQHIVKILGRPHRTSFVLSLFFRYEPQTFKLTRNKDGKVVFEVLLGNQYSHSYKNLAKHLKGLTILDRKTVDFTNPLVTSPYKDDWMSFFSLYESTLSIDIPVSFSMVPFPIIRLLPPGLIKNTQLLSGDMFDLADTNNWNLLAQQLLEMLQGEKNVDNKKLLALTYGEALARDGNFNGAFKQLYLLKEKYKDELIGTYAHYLLINLRSRFESGYIAAYQYRELAATIPDSLPLAPYFHLSRIETTLATSQFKEMNILLQKDSVPLPPNIEKAVQIRQADYWYGIKKPIKAYATYKAISDSPLLQTMPHSQGGLCATLYAQKQYHKAADCYEQLAGLINDKELLGLISYRNLMSRLKFSTDPTLIDKFSQIESVYPNTDAGFRAALKKNDLYYLRDQSPAKTVSQNYGKIAEKALLRPTSEEALFKQALVLSQIQDNTTAVILLQKLLRNYQNGQARKSAQALLIQILPLEIKRLVDNKKYMRALVLAKQNRELFTNNWIDNTFLVDIAEAYHKIGLFDEAHKLYLYLIEISPTEERENFYLPMIKATFAHGNYSLVDDYASQYFYNYPRGKFSRAVQLLRIKALVADERLQEALDLLPTPLPRQKEFLQIAASLYYRMDNHVLSLKALEQLRSLQQTLNGHFQFLLAECYYKTGNYPMAKQLFTTITPKNNFYEQSLFRLAEIERKNGNEQKALSLFAKIVEKGKSLLWKKYARRELQFAKETTNM